MIIFLHGFLGKALDWREHQEFLSQKFMCQKFWCPDLFGGDKPQSGSSLWQAARDLNLKIKGMGLRPHLVGYSYGARLALHQLLLEPDLFKSVFVAGARLNFEYSAAMRIQRSQWEMDWAKKFLKDPISDLIREWEAQDLFKDSKPLRSESEDLDYWEARRKSLAESLFYRGSSRQSGLFPDLWKLSPKIKFLEGELDTSLAREKLKCAPLISRKSLEIIKNAGHRSPWDNFSDFSDALYHWLKNRNAL